MGSEPIGAIFKWETRVESTLRPRSGILTLRASESLIKQGRTQGRGPAFVSNSKMSNNPAPLAQSSTTASRTRRAAQWAFKALVSYFALGDDNFHIKARALVTGTLPGYLTNST